MFQWNKRKKVWRNDVKLIASQCYITVTRSIEWNKQHYITNEQFLHLYEDKIVTTTNEFLIEDVLDMSYRPSSTEFGFLYLHTVQGVFPFRIKTKPYYFIDLYRDLKQ
jgi:hypothetical protein